MAMTQQERNRHVLSAGFASAMGWAMDLYDLLVILYVAAVIGPLLVPSESVSLQLTFVYASFAVTLIMRPLGSAIFGHFADKTGRKKAMIVAITGVGLVTGLMGAVPTYALAGIFAPASFVILRLAQGIFVGGVVASTHTLGTETVSPKHRGLMSGIIAGGGAGLGAVLASVVFLIVSSIFPGEQFAVIGWRVMFFSGLLTCVLSFIVFTRTSESPLWEAAEAKAKAPIKAVLSTKYLPTFLMNILLAMGGAALYYLTVGFFPTFFGSNIGLTKADTAISLIVVNIFVIIGGVAGGALSDRLGRRPVFLLFAIPMLIAGPVLYYMLGSLKPSQTVLITTIASVMALLMICGQAPTLIFLNERFPTRIRATGTALSWNIGFAIGGMGPTLVTAISPKVSDFTSRLALLVVIASLIVIVVTLLVKETRWSGLGEIANEKLEPSLEV